MKSPKDSDKVYGQKVVQPSSCPGCKGKLTKVIKSGHKEITFVCWNLGECSLALDLTRCPSWEVVPQA